MDFELIHGLNAGPMTGSGTNTYLVRGRVPTLIDAASGSFEFVEAVARTLEPGSGLAQVLITHAHPDHIGGVRAVRARWPSAIFRKMPWPERDSQYDVAWVAIADDDRVPAGNGDLRAVHTPGHSPDHLGFFDEETRTLVGGDLMVSGGTVVIPSSSSGSLTQYLHSLERVQKLAPSRVLPGHGEPIDDPLELVRKYIDHRRLREQQILAALAAGESTVEAIVRRVYENLAPGLVMMAAESVTAHLVKLEAEGRVENVGGRWQIPKETI